MTMWNHRIIRYTASNGDTIYQIAEVFYDEEGVAHSWSDPFMTGDTAEEVQETIERMQRGAMKPVLDMPADNGVDDWEEAYGTDT